VQDETEPRAVGTAEVALFCGVTEASARNWARSGQLAGAWRTPGGRWRVPRESLVALTRPTATREPVATRAVGGA
jgi:predicted site-specific integrase-resolvase